MNGSEAKVVLFCMLSIVRLSQHSLRLLNEFKERFLKETERCLNRSSVISTNES